MSSSTPESVDPEPLGGPLAALHRALLAIGTERSAEPLLERLVQTARVLVGARYAALGIPDGEGGFLRFLTVGIDDEQMARIGPLPRVHGMLGAMLDDVEPTRLDDIRSDPRFSWWPPGHPDMRSFLGVPVRSGGEVVAAYYLTDKEDAPRFSDNDEVVITMLAAHTAIAIENARLWERTREATTLAERDRLARDLHDAMTQSLFSLQLTTSTAHDALAAGDVASAAGHLGTIRRMAASLITELRALVGELRPPDLASEGLEEALRKQVALLDRLHDERIAITVSGEIDCTERVEAALWRIAGEGLANALRHGQASVIEVRVATTDDGVVLVVSDDGVGFDPEDPLVGATRLGLSSMRHRARAAGGRLTITSSPGSGTTITVEVPSG